MSERHSVPIQELLTGWSENVGFVLGEVTNSSIHPTLQAEPPAELPAASENDFWLDISCGPPLHGVLRLRIPLSCAVILAAKFMGETPTEESAFDDVHREALQEFWRQVFGRVATSVNSLQGSNLEVNFGKQPVASPACRQWLRIPEFSTDLEIFISSELEAALAQTSVSTAKEPALSPSEDSSNCAGNLDVLMKVSLKVTLRFGQRRLLLSEVLELGPGMVVELDRRVEEPVDLLLEGKVIARGDVVIVEGNYGLRVTEVLCRQAA